MRVRKEDTYKVIKSNTHGKYNLITKVTDVKLNETQFISVAKKEFLSKSKAGYRKLNRERDANIQKEEYINKKLERGEKLGYLRLETFADCYRKVIKISYCTLRTRIISNKVLLQYLLDEDYITLYAKDKKILILVNYTKRFKFIELILKAFLTDTQKESIIR